MAKSTFFKDFKAFITRGNVVDMAVGVVIGGSFSKIVTGLVNYVINPFVSLFVKSGSLDSVRTVVREAVTQVAVVDGVEVVNVVTPEVAILWGTWLQTIIDFLITAFCIFFVLRVLMKAQQIIEADKIAAAKQAEEEAKAKAEAEKAEAEAQAAALAERQTQLEETQFAQEKLLTEIRDLLAKK